MTICLASNLQKKNCQLPNVPGSYFPIFSDGAPGVFCLYSSSLPHIHSNILSSIYSSMCAGHLSGIACGILLRIYSYIPPGVYSGVLFGIYYGILPGIFSVNYLAYIFFGILFDIYLCIVSVFYLQRDTCKSPCLLNNK